MPEYPDVELYVEALEKRLVNRPLRRLCLFSPFLLRSVRPAVSEFEELVVQGVRRMGKRVVIEFEARFWMVLHLMIAGRLHWGSDVPQRTRNCLAYWQFDSGVLSLTEGGTKKRASLHCGQGSDALSEHDPGGLEVMDACVGSFVASLTVENRTLKRALTDPRIFSGIGNSYSDEILHGAKLSPVKQTSRLTEAEQRRLYDACQEVLHSWHERLKAEVGDSFPQHVTAFRDGMAVHGRYGKPCPDCGETVQRIRFANNETNYCPRCQTGGKLLADRSLSALLRKDWPKTVEELEILKRR